MKNLNFYLLVSVLGVGCGRIDYKYDGGGCCRWGSSSNVNHHESANAKVTNKLSDSDISSGRDYNTDDEYGDKKVENKLKIIEVKHEDQENEVNDEKNDEDLYDDTYLNEPTKKQLISDNVISDTWSCKSCTCENSVDYLQCICGTIKPNNSDNFKLQDTDDEYGDKKVENKLKIIEVKDEDEVNDEKNDEDLYDDTYLNEPTKKQLISDNVISDTWWFCKSCTYENSVDYLQCIICDTIKPNNSDNFKLQDIEKDFVEDNNINVTYNNNSGYKSVFPGNKTNPSELKYSHFEKKDHDLIKKFVDEYNIVLNELKNNQSNNKPTEQLFTVWYDKFKKSLIKKSLKNLFFAKKNCCNHWALKSDKNSIKNFFNKLFVHIDIYIDSVYEAKFENLNTNIDLNDSHYLVDKTTWQRAHDERKKYFNVFLQTTAPRCSYHKEYKIGDKIKYYDLTSTSLEAQTGTIQEIEKPEPKYIKLGYFVYEDNVKINLNGYIKDVCSNKIIVREEDFEEKDGLIETSILLDKDYECTLNIKPQGIQSYHGHTNTCFIISILHFLNKNNMILSEQQIINLSKSIYEKIYRNKSLFKKPNLSVDVEGFVYNLYEDIQNTTGLIEGGCITKCIFDAILEEYKNACPNKQKLLYNNYDLKNLYVYKEVGDQDIRMYPLSKYEQIGDHKSNLEESLSSIEEILKQDVTSVSFIIFPQVGHWYFCEINKLNKKITVNVRDGKLKNCYRGINKWNNEDILYVDYLSHSIKKLLNKLLS